MALSEAVSTPKVAFRHLGNSGLKVSNICLGTMTFGKSNFVEIFNGPTQSDETTAHAIMDRYIQLGGNFLDTSNIYSAGDSERIIGTWLKKQKREDIVVATKLRFRMSSGTNDHGLSRRHIIKMCEDSLDRLQTDYIDLYQTHCWDSAVPIEETLRTLDDLVRAGKIHYIGVSNVTGWQMQKIVDKAQTMGISSVVSLQQQYSLLCRRCELEAFQVCKNEGIGVLPWSSLSGGLLTGKFNRRSEMDAKGSRIGFIHQKESTRAVHGSPAWSKYQDNEWYWHLMQILNKIAHSHDKSIPQVALRWVLQKNVVSSVVIGATSVKQLEDNMGASTGWNLSLEEMDELDTATSLELRYPDEMLFMFNRERNNPHGTSSLVENNKESN